MGCPVVSFLSASSGLILDDHAVTGRGDAGAHIGSAIDDHDTVRTSPQRAEDSPRGPLFGRESENALSARHQSRREGLPFEGLHGVAVHDHRDPSSSVRFSKNRMVVNAQRRHRNPSYPLSFSLFANTSRATTRVGGRDVEGST